MTIGTLRRRTGAALSALAVVLLAGCGSTSGAASSPSEGSKGVDTAQIEKILAPYTGHASAFPVDEPLKKKLPGGAKIAFLQCATPFCSIMAELVAPAVKAMGAELTVVKADSSANGLQSAAESIISQDPAAVIIAGIDPAAIGNQLKTLDAKGTPVLSNGAIGGSEYGIDVSFNDREAMQIVGDTLAAWAVQQKGAKTHVVFYTIPELSFASIVEKAFTKKVGELCPSCSIRTVDISVKAIGSTAPHDVVSDLQAHPDSNVAIFASEEAATGLPSALKVAGIQHQVLINGFGATPAQLEEIQNRDLAASMAVDVPVIMWSLVDAAARLATGQPVTAGEKAGVPPLQMVDATALKGHDIKNGYSAYPTFAQTFAGLWTAS